MNIALNALVGHSTCRKVFGYRRYILALSIKGFGVADKDFR